MGQHTCVVAIDDDLDGLEVFSELLEIKGLQVIGKGYDGKEAASMYRVLKPDVIFLDMVMPEYDGLYGLKEIRKIDPNAKVIIVTGDLSETTQEKLKKLNPTAILRKPYDITQVLELVDQAVNGKTIYKKNN